MSITGSDPRRVYPWAFLYAVAKSPINPTNPLANSTQYFVTFAAGTVKDAANNAYAGISIYDFTTISSADRVAPTVSSFSPVDADVAASTVGPAACVGLKILRTPEDFADLSTPDEMRFVGSTEPNGVVLPHVVGVSPLAGRPISSSLTRQASYPASSARRLSITSLNSRTRCWSLRFSRATNSTPSSRCFGDSSRYGYQRPSHRPT